MRRFYPLIALFLSGCMTLDLQQKIQISENDGRKNYSADSIEGISAARNNDDLHGAAFIGRHFDYMVPGGETILKLIQQEKVAAKDIQLDDGMQFIITHGNQFSGQAKLRFSVENEKRCDDIASAFTSGEYWFSDKGCEFRFDIKNGVIHKKAAAKTYQNILTFSQPSRVGFYEDKSNFSAQRLLYPVTVIGDIATAPLQLIGIGILYGASSSMVPYH